MSDKEVENESKQLKPVEVGEATVGGPKIEIRDETSDEIGDEISGNEQAAEVKQEQEKPKVEEEPKIEEEPKVEEEPKEEEKTNEEGLKPAVSIGMPKKSEEQEEPFDLDEKAPPLPTRRKPIELPTEKPVENQGEGSRKAFPKKMENPILRQLKEAFPNIEEKYIKAVIIASQGVVDPAFHALLFLSDPASGKDIELPSRPVPQQQQPHQQQIGEPLERRQSQLEQDELLARQLDRKYNSRSGNKDPTVEDWGREDRRQRLKERHRRMQTPMSPQEYRDYYGEEPDDDMWGQFMDKDLPELRDRANKSIQDTATKLNGWISGFRKNFYGEQEELPRRSGYDYRDEAPKKPERRRFNSFGAQIGEESLESHGITLQTDVDDEDVPPQLKNKKQSEKEVVARTTYIDSPDQQTQRKKWQPVPPAPTDYSPSKQGRANSPDEDEFLLNSEDEL